MTVGGVAIVLLADGDLWFGSSSDEAEIFFFVAPNGGDVSASEKPESFNEKILRRLKLMKILCGFPHSRLPDSCGFD